MMQSHPSPPEAQALEPMKPITKPSSARSTGPEPDCCLSARLGRWAIPCILLAALLWAYWPTAYRLSKEWNSQDDYSVGMLVPFAALYLLWQERRLLNRYSPKPAWVAGICFILAAQGVRAFGLIGLFDSIERYAMVLTLWGVVLLTTGWRIFFRTFWVLAFLLLMIPLPGAVHNRIAYPLQTVATEGALVTLEVMGITVDQHGHVLVLNDSIEVAVAEACSGLRMLTAFVVVAAFLAYLVDRPPWQRIVLLLSSLPVAIICNLIRLVVTSLLCLFVSDKVGRSFFHDFAGLTMMPLAVLMLLGELWIMSLLVYEPERARTQQPS